jgi:hypothetical protein
MSNNDKRSGMTNLPAFKAEISALIREKQWAKLHWLFHQLFDISRSLREVLEHQRLTKAIAVKSGGNEKCKFQAGQLARHLVTVADYLEFQGIDPETGEISDKTWEIEYEADTE